MAVSLQMSYDDMEAVIGNLTTLVQNFTDITSDMSKNVNVLCDGWTSASTEAYRADYTALTNNFNHTIDIVNQLIESTKSYIADVKAVDTAYSSNKVS